MKVLIVNYYYPPTTDAHGYRWAEIAKFWVKSDHKVDVITGKVYGSDLSSIDDGVNVKRIGFIPKQNPKINNFDETPSLAKRILITLMNLLRPFYRKIYWPDALWYWFPAVMLELIKRRKVKYDLIISYYPCFSSPLAVAVLKSLHRKSNLDFKWIIDYGDPFCASETWQPNNYKIYNKLNVALERGFSKSGELVFSNAATADAYKAKLTSNKSFEVIPHLVNIETFYSRNYINPQTREKSEIIFCYIGSFHKNIREPHRLFALVKKLNFHEPGKYILNLYGPKNDFDMSPNDCPEIRYHGPIQREKAAGELGKADFIVNVDNENCVMTPSKIVECISTGRPIINISNSSTRYEPMENYTAAGFSISITDDIISNEIVEKVRVFVDSHQRRGQTAELGVVKKSLYGHEVEYVADKYLKLIT
jgi:hypothetical protein